MKRIVLIVLSSLFLFSCGGDKKKEIQVEAETADQYAVIIDAIYEKDDSLAVVYKKDGYYVEKPTSLIVKGSPLMQRLTVDLPQGEPVENLSITLSSNKDQEFLTIKAVSVKNGDKTIISDKDNFTTYFLFNESISWDIKTSRYILTHDKEFQPGIGGSDKLEAELTK